MDREFTTILEESPVEAERRITRDAKVQMGLADRADKKKLRLIELLFFRYSYFRVIATLV
ncbi:hypothetical protein JI735_15130 [Paenibacillus sonchi]|uniref:Uncharacterized protein n=1 Tax=Paenibacillus sonchi TaxID=373687 RepID=A0A974SFL5_9BACL|nr:hypothetical protein [Paenibacillus sonchi]QQZ63654.1 hypothetical protein JI735_15130 [Paenibacillus sonchi]